jgi:transcriptional regulator PpsR
VKSFRTPRKSLGNLDADVAAKLIAAAADVALVIDEAGVIRDVAIHSEDLARDLEGHARWVGRPWIETVTVESRPKVEQLCAEAAEKAAPRWRHVNHPTPRGIDVPVLYSAIRFGEDGRLVAFGRDLRALSELQQRLVDAQQSMERDYSRLRFLEMRYRLLFQLSSEAVLVIDATTQKVSEANPAAQRLLGEAATRRVIGRAAADLFQSASAGNVQALLAAVRSAGRADEVRARLVEGGREVLVSASLFREESASLFLVRMGPVDGESPDGGLPQSKSKMLRLIESAPDGFVVMDVDGRIITANAAFLDLAQLPTEEQARGEPLERWLGRPGVDLDILVANLRQHGSVRLFATVIRGEYGATEEVEVSAAEFDNGGAPCFGLAIRRVARRLAAEQRPHAPQLPRSIEQLTELVGRVSLKDLVRETTDVIEKLCIEAALELSGDNRASAAEMLGLSRQSLYVKLRRHGLGDLADQQFE